MVMVTVCTKYKGYLGYLVTRVVACYCGISIMFHSGCSPILARRKSPTRLSDPKNSDDRLGVSEHEHAQLPRVHQTDCEYLEEVAREVKTNCVNPKVKTSKVVGKNKPRW